MKGSNQSSPNPIRALHAQIPPNPPSRSTVNGIFQPVVPAHLQINTNAGPLSEAEKTNRLSEERSVYRRDPRLGRGIAVESP